MSFFDDAMAKVHAACDEIFAHDAVLRPAAGGTFTCKAELFLPEPEFGLNEAKSVTPEILVRVTKASVSPGADAPRKGDVIEIKSTDYRVLAKPTTEDDDGLRWTVPVEKLK